MAGELEIAGGTGFLDPSARTARRNRSGHTGVAPWTLPEEVWEALEPRGTYAQHVRGPLLWTVALLAAPLALALALPIALVNAWVLRAPRRVLFAQIRAGRRGVPFVLYKFRTLREGAGPDEQRVTAFGRFLRNTHLDELPQLWNVLRGEMCLIGPRPELIATERWAARRVPGFAERLVLAPGLTGLAQITQGYTESGDERAYREKSAWNRRYREQLSLRLDAAILARTVLWMLRRRGWRAWAARPRLGAGGHPQPERGLFDPHGLAGPTVSGGAAGGVRPRRTR